MDKKNINLIVLDRTTLAPSSILSSWGTTSRYTQPDRRQFPIEYFAPAEVARARAWLAEKANQS